MRLGFEPGPASAQEDVPVLALLQGGDALVGRDPVEDRPVLDEIARKRVVPQSATMERMVQRVPYMRSPASPNPGTI